MLCYLLILRPAMTAAMIAKLVTLLTTNVETSARIKLKILRL